MLGVEQKNGLKSIYDRNQFLENLKKEEEQFKRNAEAVAERKRQREQYEQEEKNKVRQYWQELTEYWDKYAAEVAGETIEHIEQKEQEREPELAFWSKTRETQEILYQVFSDLLPLNLNYEQIMQAVSRERTYKLRYITARVQPHSYTDYNTYQKFAPLDDGEANEILHKCGFGRRYTRSKWREVDIYQNVKQHIAYEFIFKGISTIGMYIYGNIGVGKSSIITLIAKMLLTYLNVSICCADTQKLINAFSSIEEQDKQFVKLCLNCDFLFIDALGQETINTPTQESKLAHLIRQRYDDCKTTFIASRFDVATLIQQKAIYQQFATYFNDKNFLTQIYLGEENDN